MAYTFTAAMKTVHGNQNVQQGLLTADATSGVVSFGFATITHAHVTSKSATTASARFRINALAGGTASAGDLGVSGAVSGDEYYVTVYGR